jgi:hypothetical protein
MPTSGAVIPAVLICLMSCFYQALGLTQASNEWSYTRLITTAHGNFMASHRGWAYLLHDAPNYFTRINTTTLQSQQFSYNVSTSGRPFVYFGAFFIMPAQNYILAGWGIGYNLEELVNFIDVFCLAAFSLYYCLLVGFEKSLSVLLEFLLFLRCYFFQIIHLLLSFCLTL